MTNFPSEWRIVSVGDVVSGLKSGLSRKLSPSDIGLPVLRSNNLMNGGGVDYTDIKYWYVDDPQGAKTENYVLRDDDLLINFINSISAIGKASIYSNLLGRDVIYTTNIMCLRVKRKSIIPQYFLYLTQTQEYDKYIQAITKPAVNQASFTTVDFKHWEFPLPPLPEQRKIAQILGTWDEAIATTEKLIAALERRKRGLMQRLLTGQVRKKWQTAQLSEVSQVILSGVDKKTREDDTPVRLCNYTDVFYNAYITDSMPFMEATATQREIEKCTLLEDDVIITKDSETVAEIAQAATVSESMRNVICGYHLAIIRPNPELVSGPFLRELIMTPDIHYQFEKSANGVTRFGLTGSAIESVEVIFPSLERQKEIVDVLRTNDREVDLLRSYREQLETQKKGLMQRLLTGQVRVAG